MLRRLEADVLIFENSDLDAMYIALIEAGYEVEETNSFDDYTCNVVWLVRKTTCATDDQFKANVENIIGNCFIDSWGEVTEEKNQQ